MSEFSVIERYFSGLGAKRAEVLLGVGDDAAVINIPNNHSLCVSTDTMVAGVHFLESTAARDIAYKLVAVNVSDMAAMGATPVFATLAISLPSLDEDWLLEFSESLNEQLDRFKVELVGGDTTKGPLSLTLSINGIVQTTEALTRTGAKPDEDVYLSGTVGDASLGLAVAQAKVQLDAQHANLVLDAHYRPQAQIDLGQSLVGIASACIDVSDGLLADVAHICDRSQIGIEVDLERVPLSSAYVEYQRGNGSVALALVGGDDYQLAFTAPKNCRAQIQELSLSLDIQISRIGRTTQGSAVKAFNNGTEISLESFLGYDHFHN